MENVFDFANGELVPVCRFCGQVTQMQGGDFTSHADAEEWGTRHCSCPDAKNYTMECKARETRKNKLARAHDVLETMFPANGGAALESDTIEHIFGIVKEIYDGFLEAATIKVDECTRLYIKTDSDGNVEISAKDSKTRKYHI